MTPAATALETTEQAVKALEDEAPFPIGVSPSGLRLACQVVRSRVSFQAALPVAKEHSNTMIPVLLDRIAKYSQIDPGRYEHPNDTTVLALMLLTEDAFGPTSSELRIVMVAADLLRNPWWTRQFVERMRAASQSGA